MAQQKDKAVLAYSGGLDTSVCIKWLQEEKNLDVIAVVGDVGQEHEGLEKIKQKALKTGAVECLVVDMRSTFADDYLAKALAANAMYENKYPLVSALSRPLISKHLVDAAHKFGAKYIAHGCTGKGNDQVRFEASILMLDPDIEIIAPVREWDLHTRPEEIDWAIAHGIDVPATKKSPYSIDDNLWGRAIECGVLEDPWMEPPSDIYTMTADPTEAPDEPQYVELEFARGLPYAIDGNQKSFLGIIYALNEIAGKHGYGRIDMIENRLVGVKSRECYEVPGALSLIQAHKALEDLVLEREVLHFKLGMEQEVGEVRVQRPVVLAAQGSARRLPRLHAALPGRHGEAEVLQGLLHRGGPEERLLAVRLRAGHLRQGRTVRPRRGQGLHPAADAVGEDVGLESSSGRRAGRAVRRSEEGRPADEGQVRGRHAGRVVDRRRGGGGSASRVREGVRGEHHGFVVG